MIEVIEIDITSETLALDFVKKLPETSRVCLRDDWGDCIIKSWGTKGVIGYLTLFAPKARLSRVYKNPVSYEVYLGEVLE